METSANTYEIRPLTDDELAELETALGSPIERNYLAYWMRRAIEAFIALMTAPAPRERRDDLRDIAEQGRKWIDTVGQSSTTALLPPVLEVEQLMSLVRRFCDGVDSLARQLDQAVGPSHPRTNAALDAFLETLIGIAKRANVLPSAPSRAALDPIDSPTGPPFFAFVNNAFDIAMEVIRSSPLSKDQIDQALVMLSSLTDQLLVKALERLRGRIGDYREGRIGLTEWDIAASGECDRPEHPQSSAR